MHNTTIERHVHTDEDFWQVRCQQCGIVAEHIETEELTSFLAGLHRAVIVRYVRTKEPTGRTHVLNLETAETLCGAKSRLRDTDSHPDLATCLLCWKTWEQLDGTTMQHATGLTANSQPLPSPYRSKDNSSIRATTPQSQT